MNRVDLNKAWVIMWNNDRVGEDKDTRYIIKEICLRVEKATNFFRSDRNKEDREARRRVNPVRRLSVNRENLDIE